MGSPTRRRRDAATGLASRPRAMPCRRARTPEDTTPTAAILGVVVTNEPTEPPEGGEPSCDELTQLVRQLRHSGRERALDSGMTDDEIIVMLFAALVVELNPAMLSMTHEVGPPAGLPAH